MRTSLFVLFFALGCGAANPSTSDDASTDDVITVDDATSVDAGGDAITTKDGGAYPAFAPDMPQILDHGGNVLATPRIVTITWDADPNAATYEAFGDAIGASNYWSSTTKEYGIAPATSGAQNHVRIATAPSAKMSDTALDAFVAAQVGAAWPATDANTVFIVYLPEAMELTSNGQDACGVEDGYHDETYTSANAPIVYAVVDESCHGTDDVVVFSTETASHELVESATDPFLEEGFAWYGFDADHYAWEEWTQRQDELADACQFNDDAYYTDVSPLAYALQRSWSNASAKAGHNPCVPAPSIPNTSGVALGTQSITVTVGAKSITTHGYMIPVGQMQTIHVGLYSDAPTSDFSVSIVEGDGFSTPSPHLTITQSATTGNNGDVIDVTITATATRAQGVLATIVTTQNNINHYVPFLVATQ